MTAARYAEPAQSTLTDLCIEQQTGRNSDDRPDEPAADCSMANSDDDSTDQAGRERGKQVRLGEEAANLTRCHCDALSLSLGLSLSLSLRLSLSLSLGLSLSRALRSSSPHALVEVAAADPAKVRSPVNQPTQRRPVQLSRGQPLAPFAHQPLAPLRAPTPCPLPLPSSCATTSRKDSLTTAERWHAKFLVDIYGKLALSYEHSDVVLAFVVGRFPPRSCSSASCRLPPSTPPPPHTHTHARTLCPVGGVTSS